MSKRRYSVWTHVDDVIMNVPEYETWHAAKEELDAWRQDRFDQFRIWDHSTTPPTDVTDADPEAETKKRWWQCHWHIDHTEPSHLRVKSCSLGRDDIGIWFFPEGGLRSVWINIHSATAPTFAEFRAAVKAATGVDIPEPEEPRWWEWLHSDADVPTAGQWCEYYDQNRKHTSAIAQGAVNDIRCIVYGTTADRDAKRDALLEAARAAGKPS